MKIRNGYVSNSSSSSFVMFGVSTQAINKENAEEFEEIEDHYYREGITIIDPNYNDGSVFVGKEIISWGDDDYEVSVVSLSEIEKEVRIAFEKLGIPCDNLSIIAGINPSY